MRTITKAMAGIATAAMISVTAAAPAEARHRYYHRDRGGVDVGDVVAGAAIVGGIAAIAHGINQRNRYDRGYTYGRPYAPAYGNGAYGQSYAPAYGNGYAYPGGGYDYRGSGYGGGYAYGNGYGGTNDRLAVDLCAREASRYGQFRDIDDIDREYGSVRVRGDIDVRDYRDRDGYDKQSFTCTVAGDRIYDFRVEGRRW